MDPSLHQVIEKELHDLAARNHIVHGLLMAIRAGHMDIGEGLILMVRALVSQNDSLIRGAVFRETYRPGLLEVKRRSFTKADLENLNITIRNGVVDLLGPGAVDGDEPIIVKEAPR